VIILPAGQYPVGINSTRWTIFFIVLILPAGICVFRVGIYFAHCTLFPINTALCMIDDISKLNI
jgi:hypothetical protein